MSNQMNPHPHSYHLVFSHCQTCLDLQLGLLWILTHPVNIWMNVVVFFRFNFMQFNRLSWQCISRTCFGFTNQKQVTLYHQGHKILYSIYTKSVHLSMVYMFITMYLLAFYSRDISWLPGVDSSCRRDGAKHNQMVYS